MADDRSPAEIEREIEVERAALASSINQLKSELSPDRLMEQASAYLRDNGGETATAVTRHMRENPAAAAMVLGGIAWLIIGSGREKAVSVSVTPTAPVPALRRTTEIAEAPAHPAVGYDHHDSEPVAGLNRAADPYAGFDDRLARADAAMNTSGAYGTEEDTMTYSNTPPSGQNWSTGDASSQWKSRQRNYGLGNADSGSRAGNMRDRAYEKSSDLLHRMSEGTESLSGAARDRVMQARHAAYEAQRHLEDRASKYASQGRAAYDSQPLIGGLIAVGIGAAIGAMLPRTEQEDRYLGSYRDRAFDEADRIFHEESGKLRAVAEAALDEAKSVVTDAMDSTPSAKEAADAAEGRIRSAADRVVDRAEDEAEKQKLGSSLK